MMELRASGILDENRRLQIDVVDCKKKHPVRNYSAVIFEKYPDEV